MQTKAKRPYSVLHLPGHFPRAPDPGADGSKEGRVVARARGVFIRQEFSAVRCAEVASEATRVGLLQPDAQRFADRVVVRF